MVHIIRSISYTIFISIHIRTCYINVVKRNGKDLYLSGAMIPPLINMYLMEIDFTYFIVTVLTSQLICIVSFFGIWRIGEKLKSRSDSEKTNDSLLLEKY